MLAFEGRKKTEACEKQHRLGGSNRAAFIA
jgi:hypothetical protein